MNPTSKYTLGIRFGFIAGLLYVVLLICRFKYFGSNPQSYSVFSIASYFVIILCFLTAAIKRKKELGGYVHTREIFQTVFVSILITEALYVLFVIIYTKFIDPGFLKNFESSSRAYYHSQSLTVQNTDDAMKAVDNLTAQLKPSGLIVGFGPAVVIDSIFGFIFAFILRKRKPLSEESKKI